MYKEVNKIDFKKEMKEEKYSKEDIMVKGKRVKIETKIKNETAYHNSFLFKNLYCSVIIK